MISFAPAACRPWAMPQAILRLLATPKTTAVRPSILNDMRGGSTTWDGNSREPTILMNFGGNEKLRKQGTSKAANFETKELRNQGTSKPTNFETKELRNPATLTNAR